jgi:glucosamine--fructose-6-phosphate aminotransferase (isomerizing)
MASDLEAGVIPREIAEGPSAIRETIAVASERVADIADTIRKRSPRRIWVVGNGTSFHTCLFVSGYARRLAGPDDPTVLASTAGDFRAFRPRLDERDVVIGISASGEFRDVVGAFRDVRDIAPTIGVVHVPDSSVARIATHVVVAAGGPSIVPVMTKTFSSTLTAAAMLISALLGRDLGIVAAALGQAASAADAAIAASLPLVTPLAALLATTEHLFVVGDGLAYPAALEAALKLKEMALVHAEASETWEMMSGASTIVGPDSAVIILAPAGPGFAATAAIAQHSREWGAAVALEVATEQAVADSTFIGLPLELDDTFAPLFAVPPVALFAYALARARGVDPDQPDWVARYHQQGLHHILGG